MLAYVFWHWPRTGVPQDRYESLQRRFHAALRDAPPPGFLGSTSDSISGASWISQSATAYEDWYLLENGSALDSLNDAAITASRQAPHDEAAAAAAGGTAGLYRLRLGRADGPAPTVAAWFPKPDGMSYASLDASIAPLLDSRTDSLWYRRMVLGPTPEFCLRSASPVALPRPFDPLVIRLHRIWPVSSR